MVWSRYISYDVSSNKIAYLYPASSLIVVLAIQLLDSTLTGKSSV